MMNLKIVYPLSVSRVNQDGSPYEFTETRFFDQTKLFVDYQKIDSAYIAKDDDNYYLIPDEASVEINPEMHGFGNPDINEAYKRTENVSDYTKAYAAFGKDRTLDYSAQIDKDLLDTNTENILGVSLVKVDENYQPQQVMPSAIGTGEQRVPTNNALLKETLDLIRSHIANKSNAHAIESISELSSSLNQLAESIGEATQAINKHASSTTNPHATNVTQEFADTQITPLSTETTYTPTVWSYLVGLFTTVPKSALQHLVKLWGVVNNLAVRIGLLEDNYLLKYVVPVNTTSINLTTDRYGNAFNFVEGDKFEVSFSIKAWVFVSSNLNKLLLRINNLATSIYYISGIAPQPEFITTGTAYKNQRTMLSLTVNNGEVIGMVTNQSVTGADARISEVYTLHTIGLNASSIVSINLRLSNNESLIPAGTVILVKKL